MHINEDTNEDRERIREVFREAAREAVHDALATSELTGLLRALMTTLAALAAALVGRSSGHLDFNAIAANAARAAHRGGEGWGVYGLHAIGTVLVVAPFAGDEGGQRRAAMLERLESMLAAVGVQAAGHGAFGDEPATLAWVFGVDVPEDVITELAGDAFAAVSALPVEG